ncbi:MAG: PVC-type heme-binding CxxCH protein, partial [Planctomycetota bacterium]
MILRVLVLLVLWSVTSLVSAQPDRKKVPFLNPKQAIDKMTMTEGFQVNAFAAEPDVVQPFAFCFDERGRLWVAENLNYLTRGSDSFNQGPKGRIAILEDVDGDGTFDKRKVFADKIFFPSGLALGFGGVWVGSPPNLLFIPDADRDDKPDGAPQVVLDGWGRHDRHETLNSFLWGPDGWLYGCHGVFTHSRVGKPGTPEEDRVPINAGLWRYHPTKEKFEVFAWGTSNPWGLDFDDLGQAFLTACVIPHLWHMVQGGRYHRQAGRHFNPHVFDDIKTIANHRHKSAHGGARFYLADAFPEKYRKRLFMCNIHDHDVQTDILERRGSGFMGRHGDQFLASNDPQWLGFNMEIGPEGAVYVIDWHDQDICGRKVHHEETGRIWRISYQGTKAVVGFDLTKKTDAELVALHTHANDWYVRQARRLIQERAAKKSLAAGTRASLWKLFDEHESVPKKLRALWSLHVSGGITERGGALLMHDSEYVRAWAIQLLCEPGEPNAEILSTFATMARSDPSAFVRLYLASACQRISVEKRWAILEGLVSHAEDKADHNLPLMYWYALEPAVVADSKRALSLVKGSKVPKLTSYVSRRVVAKSFEDRKKKSKRVKAAASVDSKGLALWLRADYGIRSADGDDGKVARWVARAGSAGDATSPNAGTRPKLNKKLGGRTAIQFDGADDRLIIPHSKDISFGKKDSFSLSVWAFIGPTQGGWRSIVAKSRERQPWYGIWIDPERRWVFGGSNANLARTRVKSGWHHVAVVQEGGGARRLFVDGTL